MYNTWGPEDHACHQWLIKKRKQKGWELDNNDDGNTKNEYPVAMNELRIVMCDAEDDERSVSSESSIE
jgi:hypothetical protein